ncbi:MAG TPA: DUF1016 domain-containing protein [Alcaligenaceae bacterium]|nr:DUF1016 domain-containing protein [Alcaligenaceae bacterium]
MNDEKKVGSVADQSELTRLVEPIAQIIEQARAEVRYAVNQAMVDNPNARADGYLCTPL